MPVVFVSAAVGFAASWYVAQGVFRDRRSIWSALTYGFCIAGLATYTRGRERTRERALIGTASREIVARTLRTGEPPRDSADRAAAAAVVERRLRKPWLFAPALFILLAAALAVLAIEDHAGGEGAFAALVAAGAVTSAWDERREHRKLTRLQQHLGP